jgi:hypothetical protein
VAKQVAGYSSAMRPFPFRFPLSLLFSALISTSAFASDELDPGSRDALAKTDDLLRSPDARQELFQKDAQARATNEQVVSMAGSDANAQAIYELAAEVFGTLTKEANGDPQKMLQLLQQAQAHPEAFAKAFTPEQRAQLEALTKKIETKRWCFSRAPPAW